MTKNTDTINKIIIVLKAEDWRNNEGYKQGFVVEPSNKEQLQTARDWASTKTYTLFNQLTETPGNEIYTDNKDFKLSLLDCAENSTQNGKLSFWNCLIEKDGLKMVIGIAQTSLLSMLKQSTLINGTVSESLSLVKSRGTCGIVHSGMEEWKAFNKLSDTSISKQKTTKWELGKSYATLTLDHLYLGDLYCWAEVETKYVEEVHNGGFRSNNKINVGYDYIKVTDTPKLMHFTTDSTVIKKEIEQNKISSLSELFKHLTAQISKVNEKSTDYSVYKYVPISESNGLVSTFKSRELGKISLDNTDCQADFDEYIKLAQLKLMSMGNGCYSVASEIISEYMYTTNKDVKPIFTDEIKDKIIKSLRSKVYIDFGDGIYLRGTHK